MNFLSEMAIITFLGRMRTSFIIAKIKQGYRRKFTHWVSSVHKSTEEPNLITPVRIPQLHLHESKAKGKKRAKEKMKKHHHYHSSNMLNRSG